MYSENWFSMWCYLFSHLKLSASSCRSSELIFQKTNKIQFDRLILVNSEKVFHIQTWIDFYLFFLIIRTRSLFISWLIGIRRLMQFDNVKEFNQQNVVFLVHSEICCSKYVNNNKKQKKLARNAKYLLREKRKWLSSILYISFLQCIAQTTSPTLPPQEEKRVVYWFKNKWDYFGVVVCFFQNVFLLSISVIFTGSRSGSQLPYSLFQNRGHQGAEQEFHQYQL